MPGPYSEKQKKIAKIAEPRDKLTGADFKALGKKNKKAYGGSIKKMKKGGEYKGYDVGGEVISGNCNRRRGQYS
jgi:hypothetical protein